MTMYPCRVAWPREWAIAAVGPGPPVDLLQRSFPTVERDDAGIAAVRIVLGRQLNPVFELRVFREAAGYRQFIEARRIAGRGDGYFGLLFRFRAVGGPRLAAARGPPTRCRRQQAAARAVRWAPAASYFAAGK